MCNRLRITVMTVRGCVEDYTAVELGYVRRYALLHFGIPELQLATVIAPPIPIQIYQDINPPLKIQSIMIIEVGVNRKMTAL